MEPRQRTRSAAPPAERMIDAHVAQLERALVGGRHAKSSLLREARDGLRDEFEGAVAQGMAPEVAAAHAIRSFGAVRQVAPQFQRELAMADLQRSSWLVAGVLVAQPLLWGWIATSAQAGGLFTALDTAAGWLAVVVLGLALLVILGCGVGLRYAIVDGRVLSIAGAALLCACGLFALLGLAMWAVTGGGLSMFAWLTGILLLPLAVVASGARRCVGVLHA